MGHVAQGHVVGPGGPVPLAQGAIRGMRFWLGWLRSWLGAEGGKGLVGYGAAIAVSGIRIGVAELRPEFGLGANGRLPLQDALDLDSYLCSATPPYLRAGVAAIAGAAAAPMLANSGIGFAGPAGLGVNSIFLSIDRGAALANSWPGEDEMQRPIDDNEAVPTRESCHAPRRPPHFLLDRFDPAL
jgi:hypothetical protein